MSGGRFDSALTSRLIAIALVVAFAATTARGQYPAGGPAAPPLGAASGNSLLSGAAPPSGSVPTGVMPSIPMPKDSAPPIASTPQVVDVRIEGNKAVDAHKIMPHIKTRAGRPLDKSTVEDDVKRLTKTHQFINVEPRYERREDGGIVIIYHVIERPLIRYVKIYGSTKKESTLKKKAGLKEGDALDPYAVEEARTKLEEYLHSKAYSQASVTIIEGTKPGDRGVQLMVNEGLKQKIWDVTFEGNTVAPDKRMETQIQSKPPILWLFKGEVDYTRIDEDVRRLTDYYRGLGFFRARVGREWIFNEKQNWMTLNFIIDEGPRYTVNNVSVIGNSRLQAEALTKDLKLTGGNFFDQGKLNKDITGVQDKYGEVGYIFADVQPETRFLEQPGQLDLVYKIEEGDRYRVGRIDVKIGGDNPHTRRTAILNRLSLRTGDIANTKKLRDSERRLKASQMLANQPAQGQVPKIVFAKPGMEDEEDADTSIARNPRGRHKGPGVQAPMGLGGMGGGGGGMGGGGMNGMGFNGQSPDPTNYSADDGELHEGESAEVELIPEGLAAPTNRTTQVTTVARPWITGDTREVVVRAQSPGGSSSSFGQQPLGRLEPDAPAGATRYGGANTGVTRTQFIQPVPGGGYAPSSTPPSSYAAQNAPTAIPPAVTPSYSQPGGYSAPGGYAAPNQYGAPPANTIPAYGSAPPAYGQPAYSQPPVYAPPAGGYAAPGGGAAYGQSVLPPPSAVPNGQMPPNVPPLLNNAPAGAVASPGGYAGPGDVFPPGIGPTAGPFEEDPPRDIPIRIMGNETQTGRLMLGIGVNSNAGLIGNITLDEQNFDWRRWPTSWEDIRNATAFRGGGQQFRIQASPGTVYQQYQASFQNPYLFDTPVSFGLSGSYFTRIYNNWTEKRLGGRVSLGYQFLFDPNLSTIVSLRAENVNISNPTVPTPPELESVLGNNSFFSGKWDIVHDTRDSAFLATQGHRIDIGLEQAFGTYVFPRATINVSQHFLLHERPDTSGRQTLSFNNQTGFTGSNTPIYENFFAGGYTTLRGFYFRGASPLDENVQVGGHFMFINSVEYMFPITGDDMLRGVAFTDFGTVEPSTEMHWDDFRVSPGLGLRVTVPAMGPAPIALDFAVPLHHAPGDQLQLFSFFIGVNR